MATSQPGFGSMDSLFSRFADLVLKQPIRGDDFVDRLHHYVTVAILICFAVGTALQEYVGEPINCWTPPSFHYDNYHAHINSYCWTHNLRYPKYERGGVQARNQSLGMLDLTKPRPLVSFGTAFYRWATLLFLLQVFLFKLPHLLWIQMSGSSGADLKKIRDLSLKAQQATEEKKKKLAMDEVVAYFENWVSGYRKYKLRLAGRHSERVLSVLFCLGRKSGNFLSSLYITSKLLNILNVIGNFAILTVFLDVNFWKYGLVLVNSVIQYGDWQDPYNFPRLLICDFVVEGSEGDEDVAPAMYHLQCTMTLNLLLEKVFALEWFWLIFLFIISLVNLVTWVLKVKPPFFTVLFSKTYIKPVQARPAVEVGLASMITSTSVPDIPEDLEKQFIADYLKSDGVFVLTLLEMNSDKSLVADLVQSLWDRYRIMNRCGIRGGESNGDISALGDVADLERGIKDKTPDLDDSAL